MSKLTDFLIANPVDNITEKVTLPLTRDDKTTEAEFEIRIMNDDEFHEYQSAATRMIGRGRKQRIDFNAKIFRELVILNHTIEPNFKDAAAIKKAGCATSEQYLNKILKSGERIDLADAINELSGFSSTMDDLIDDAKNSSRQETETPNTLTSALLNSKSD